MKMKRCIILTFISLILIQSQQVSSADTWQRVKWVIDGDTIVLSNGPKVRYIGIDAPELAHDDHEAEPYGVEAKRFNAMFLGFLLNG